MTTEELEQLIDGQAESPNLDFKDDCPWSVKTMAKDLIAMSNLQDGGRIIIGVKELGQNFSKVGVCEENLRTYKIDHMRDQMVKYADPAVDIKVYYPEDSSGKKYVVIRVLPFREIPILSKADIAGELKAGMLYYRNSNRRIESGPVSNVHDLRDIIELAAVRLMQRRKQYGYMVEPSDTELLDKEYTAIPESALLKKIKSRGYWEIRFTPTVVESSLTLRQCLEIVERCQVKADWSFPWIPRRKDEKEKVYPSDRCYESESEWGARKEFWRMYQSQQFIMYSALIDDWYEEDGYRRELAQKYPSGQFVSYFSSIIHLITQCVSFAERLAREGLYKEGVKISLTLHKTRNRQLNLDASGRVPFVEPRITLASKIPLEQELAADQLTTGTLEISNRFILKTLEYFDFHPMKETILTEQKNLLEGRL